MELMLIDMLVSDSCFSALLGNEGWLGGLVVVTRMASCCLHIEVLTKMKQTAEATGHAHHNAHVWTAQAHSENSQRFTETSLLSFIDVHLLLEAYLGQRVRDAVVTALWNYEIVRKLASLLDLGLKPFMHPLSLRSRDQEVPPSQKLSDHIAKMYHTFKDALGASLLQRFAKASDKRRRPVALHTRSAAPSRASTKPLKIAYLQKYIMGKTSSAKDDHSQSVLCNE
eukprot:4256656-Amphidinium_carterae.1